MSVKTKIEKLQRYFKHQLRLASNTIFNAEVRAQRKNPNLIPIIIINFNQLFYLKQLIESLQKRDYNNIVIIDNLSTYQPLLDYYKTIETEVNIHRLKTNEGHLSFWEQSDLVKKYTKG